MSKVDYSDSIQLSNDLVRVSYHAKSNRVTYTHAIGNIALAIPTGLSRDDLVAFMEDITNTIYRAY